jgi:hypothetical protein
MSKKNNFLATGAFYLLVGVLLFYAASRTLHFVQNVMANSTWGYLFLFATGIGAVIWLYVYLSYAKGFKQRAVSFFMGIFDLIGELALVYADTVYVGSQAGLVKMSENEMSLFITVSVIVVGFNILAGYFFKLWDLQSEQEQHAQDLVDHITDETMKHLNTPEAKQQMVQELLPIYKQSIAARVQAEIFSRASNSGLDARALGWPLNEVSPNDKKEQTVPFLSRLLKLGKTRKNMSQDETTFRNQRVAWIEMKDGSRKRIFCMTCQRDGKADWYSEEPCEHVLNATPEPANIHMLNQGLKEAFEGEQPVG